jgi:7-carboxy-7-deazaguanine synthase (Cx14CxxC type)
MAYFIKEIFYSLQGEGQQQGRPAVFCRFTGCNLWSGLQPQRAQAVCDFCDTDFVGTDGQNGGYFHSAADLAVVIRQHWPDDSTAYVVCTGGEPLLQLDEALIDALHRANCQVAVETNGTKPAPKRLDWLCVSPKARSHLLIKQGDELKLVYPQTGLDPAQFERLNFRYFYLQPIDNQMNASLPDALSATQLCLDYCLAHPKWRLSLQLHKILKIA